MAPLRFGLVGTGHWALHTHGTALTSSPEAELRGVWGRAPAKAADLAGRLGVSAYEDLDDLFAEVDAVAVAVPPDVQAEIAVRAAKAGCHLLLDKPLALTVEGARRVVRAVEEAGVASVVFFTARFRPEMEHWTDGARAAGPWHSAHLVHYANIFQPGSPYAASAWRREYGALWDVGPHALAAILPLLGPVNAVSARRGAVGTDTVHLVLSHGALAAVPAPIAALAGADDPGAGEQRTGGLAATLSLGDDTPPFAAEPVLDDEAIGSSIIEGAVNGDDLPVGPPPGEVVSSSTLSLSLTMPPAATASNLVLYGERGTRERPEGRFDATDAFRRAVSELAGLVATGERAHRCDVRFGLEVVTVLAAAERALELPGVELRS